MSHHAPAVPQTMRAAVLSSIDEGLEIRTIRTPRPRAGEVLVKVTACGLCHSDLHVLSGAIAFPLPAVLGHEVAGRVVEFGPNTEHSGLEVGQQVVGAFLMPCGFCSACASGRDDLCGPFFEMNRLKGTLYDGETRLADLEGKPIAMYSMGGLAEYCVTPVTAVAPVPDTMDPVASAILGCAALTAYGAVRRSADLRTGQSVAVIATGGVGSNVIQLSRAFGARDIIAIDVSDEKLENAKALGATDVVNSFTENVRERVFEITGGVGVDVAFEVLGSPHTWETALNVLRDGGRMVPIGLGAGVQTAGVEINRTVRRSQSIVGSYGALTRQDLPEVIRLAEAGVIRYKDIVTRQIRLEEVASTYGALRRGEIQGRAVVKML